MKGKERGKKGRAGKVEEAVERVAGGEEESEKEPIGERGRGGEVKERGAALGKEGKVGVQGREGEDREQMAQGSGCKGAALLFTKQERTGRAAVRVKTRRALGIQAQQKAPSFPLTISTPSNVALLKQREIYGVFFLVFFLLFSSQ